MPGFLLAISASLCWGVSDFLGGLTSRAGSVLRVLAISQPAGLVLVTVITLSGGHQLPGGASALLAGLAGVASVGALGLFYAAMTRASMIVIAPVAATGAMIAVAVGLIRGEAITVIATAGVILALAGGPAAAWEPGSNGHPRRGLLGPLLAAGAGICTGLWLTFMNLASQSDPLGATEVMRLTACVIAIAAFGGRWYARSGRTPAAPRTGPAARTRLSQGVISWLAIMAIGVTDALAEISYASASASASGQLSIISALSSLYPAVTVGLAAVVLRERVHPVQAAGATAALVAAVLLAI